ALRPGRRAPVAGARPSALTATAGSREEPSDAQLAPPGRPGARVRDLGGGGALRDAPPDPAPVRPPGPGDPAAHPGPRPPLQHPRHRTPAGDPGTLPGG